MHDCAVPPRPRRPHRYLARRYRVVLIALLALLGAFVLPTAVAAQDDDTEGEAYFGTLRFEGEPVEGVTITVTDLDGLVVGVAVSDADGAWRVALPGPGTYRATIEIDSLPDGVDLRDPDRQTLEVRVQPGRARPLNFALGEFVDLSPGFGERLAQALLNGVKLGLIVAMASVGLSLIFGTTGLINSAHGELVTFGDVAAWYFNARTVEAPLVFAAVLALVLSGVLGAALEMGVLRPLRARKLGAFQFVVLTIGLSLLGRHLLLLFFGGNPERYTDYTLQSEWNIGFLSITPRDLTIMLLSIAVLIGVALYFTRGRLQ